MWPGPREKLIYSLSKSWLSILIAVVARTKIVNPGDPNSALEVGRGDELHLIRWFTNA